MNDKDVSELTIDYHKPDKSGKSVVTIGLPDGTTMVERLCLPESDERAQLAERVCLRFPGVDAEEFKRQLESAAAEQAQTPEDSGRSSPATALVELVESDPRVCLFHTSGGTDAEAFMGILDLDRHETIELSSKTSKRWLARQYYLHTKRAIGSQALTDAIAVLTGKALFEGPTEEVHTRLAEHGGNIYLDLADDKWRAIEIGPSGWRVLRASDVPVRFVRSRSMRPLPVPHRGGSWDDLRELVNLPADDQWHMAMAWAVAAFRPNRPFAVLNVNGEQGSAKSTLCKMLRSIVDPAKPLLRRPPKDERELAIAASKSWVVAYDNISVLTQGLSDALCTIATGGGYAARELYSDGDEKLFDATRPILINGIDDAVTRSDLLDRCVNLHLTTITSRVRRDEDELWSEFEARLPGILGVVLDAVSMGLQRYPSVKLANRPRMAAFARWVVAAEPALPWQPGAFMAAYQGNRADANSLAIEASLIGPAVLRMMEERTAWEGTAQELRDLIESNYVDERTKARKDWPSQPRAVRDALRRVAPNLRAVGVEVSLPEKRAGQRRDRLILLSRASEPSVTSVASVTSSESEPRQRVPAPSAPRPTEVTKVTEVPGEPRPEHRDLYVDILAVLSDTPATADALLEAWPASERPMRTRLEEELRIGVARGHWNRASDDPAGCARFQRLPVIPVGGKEPTR